MEIVINSCFGGFGLSEKGYRRYAELKGMTLYPEKDRYGLTTYWTVPAERRKDILTEDQWQTASKEARIRSNKAHSSMVLYDLDIERDDPFLVEVVRELGKKADGPYASLEIVEVPDDVSWEISAYDGNEHVAETHRTWG